MENIYFIYKYEWSDGSIYIGQSNHNSIRFNRPSHYKECPKVYNKMKKYKDFSAIILKDNLSKYDADYYEKFYIKHYNTYMTDKGLNLSSGGEGNFGYQMSEELRKKLSERNIGNKYSSKENYKRTKEHTENQRKSLKELYKNNDNPKNKPIYKYDLDGNLINEYKSVKEASLLNNISSGAIRNCANNKTKTSGGFIWKWKII